MRNLISGALSVLMAFGLMLSLATVASANPIAGGGYSSSYAGESVFTNNAAGETGQFSAIFFNDGQVAWSPGVVGLLICAPDKITCNVSQNASYAKNWFSSTVYATATSTVAPGQNGFFLYNFTVPAGTAASTATTFYGDVGLIATGAELRPQGYFQVNTTPTVVTTLTISPTSANVPVGGTQQFTVTGQGSATVTWTVNGGCGAVTTDGNFVATAQNAASQPCSVQASASGGTATAPITVFGPATQLGCSASPATVVANGGTGAGKTTATISLKDSNGNIVSNASSPSITITNVTPTGSVTPASGIVTVAVSSTLNPGTIQLSASASGLTGCNVQIPSTAPGSSSSTSTTFTVNPIAADGVSTTTLRIEVTDAGGNRNVNDNSTTLNITRDSGAGICNMIAVTQGTGASVGPGSTTATVVQGRVDVTVQSTSTPGSCTFTNVTNNSTISGSSGTLTTQIVGVANRITVTSNDSPHPASASGSCTVAGSQAGTNTNVSCTTIVLAIRDANGAQVTSDSGRAITVSFDSGTCTGATPGNVTLSDSTTTSGGSATIDLKSAGAYPNCRITFSSGTLTGTSTTATWTGGAADHLACSFSPNPIPPDNTAISVGTVSVRDSAGNVVNGSYSVNFSRTGGGGVTSQQTANPQTTTNGLAYFTVKANTSTGTDTYTPSIASGSTLPGTNTSCTITVQ
jgi:adhesin/invasin